MNGSMNGPMINGQSNNPGLQQQNVFANNMSQSNSQLLTQPPSHHMNMGMPPASASASSVPVYQSPSASYNSQLMERLNSIDNKLKSLDSIEKQLVSMNNKISGLDLRLQENEKSVKTLNAKVSDLEDSRNFDAGVIDQVKKTETGLRKELDQTKHMTTDINKAAEERHKMKEDYTKLKAENDKLKRDLTDLKGRSMRNNLMFYNLAERQENRQDENCEEKVIQFCEVELEQINARNELVIERAHRIGEYKPTKTRPIVVRFNNYKQKEAVKKVAISKLTDSIYAVGDQFPKEVQDKRRDLLPAKKSAQRKGQRAVFLYDKLYIDGVLYKPPVTQNTDNTNATGV